MRRAIAAATLCLGFAAPALAQAPDLSQFQGKRALDDIVAQVSFGVRAMGTPGHQKTVALIDAQLRALGVEPRQQNGTVTVAGQLHRITNIIASINPAAPRRLILGTHYDSIIRAYRDKDHPEAPMPGANNSASGVALLLETARALHAQPTPPSIGIDLVFFDGEEGALSLGEGDANFAPLGSPYFATHLADIYPRAKPEQAVIFDMVCWREEKLRPEEGSLHFAAGLVGKFWNIGRTFAPAFFSSAPTPGEILDDQAALDEAHIPALLVIGFDYEPWYNTTEDTPDKCSEAALNGVGRTLLRYVYAP
jgi:Zn-dependent M28 family amino/carboxypeptidase